MSIGERITELRKAVSLSQDELAKCLNVSRQAVSKWENDLSSPDTLKLIRLADVLNTEVEYLATGKKPVYQEAPIVVNIVKKVDKVVEKVVEKPVVRRVVRIKYRTNPMILISVGAVCAFLGLLIGWLLL